MSSSEGPVLDHFIGQARDYEPGGNSPRTELLSTTSHLPQPPDILDRTRRAPPDRFRHERELHYSQSSPKELLSRLIELEYDNKRTVDTLLSRLDAESKRAAEAERRLRRVSAAKQAAEQTALKASEELKIYQRQCEVAAREIENARQVVKVLEDQRDEAERKGAESRSVARQLERERKVMTAREEGRQLGFEAGFRRAQEEYQLTSNGSNRIPFDTSFLPRVYARDYGAARRDDVSERTVSTYQRPMIAFPAQSEAPPIPIPPPIQEVQETEPQVQLPEPIVQPVPAVASPRPSMIRPPPTPAISHYEVEVPTQEAIERAERQYQTSNNQFVAAAPWPAPSASTEYLPPRPSSRNMSPAPPDNFIPVLTDGTIKLPPPNELPSPYSQAVQLPPDDPKSAAGSTKGKGKGKAQSWYTAGPSTATDQGWYSKKPGPPSIASSATSRHTRRTSMPATSMNVGKDPLHHRRASDASNSSRVSQFDLLQAPPKPRSELSTINEHPSNRSGSLQQKPSSQLSMRQEAEASDMFSKETSKGKRQSSSGRPASVVSSSRMKTVGAKQSSMNVSDRPQETSPESYRFQVIPPSQPSSGNPVLNASEQMRYMGTPTQSTHALPSTQYDTFVSTVPNSPTPSKQPLVWPTDHLTPYQQYPLQPNLPPSGRVSPRPGSVHNVIENPTRDHNRSPRPTSIVSALSGHRRGGPNTSTLDLPQEPSSLKRVPSSGSIRSNVSRTSSYARFDKNTYLDPAFNSAAVGGPSKARTPSGSDLEYM